MQTYESIPRTELFPEASRRKRDGWRLAQISVTDTGVFDILYSFERDSALCNLRVELPHGAPIDSVSGAYPYAYLYENEMKDLFGVDVQGMNVDFQGNLYQVAVKTPFMARTEPDGEGALK